MSLRTSYTLLAPLYDILVKKATSHWREQSLQQLDIQPDERVLLNGVGTGLDFPHVPVHGRYVATDLTYAMLKRARHSAASLNDLDIEFQLSDGSQLPFKDNSFDCIVLHLILAVVPTPEKLLSESTRVLKPGGRITIVDKFLKPGQRAPLRRGLNLLSRHVATRMDVVFEEVLESSPALSIINDTPLQAGSWFRNIILVKE